jgi:hypothetical protein
MNDSTNGEIVRRQLSYLGNPLVKRDGVNQSWTKEQVTEYAKCLKDPIYFAKNYIKVISLGKGLVNFNLYPYQEKIFNSLGENRFTIILSPRQSGKCVTGETKIKIRKKNTDEEFEISMDQFHKMVKQTQETF